MARRASSPWHQWSLIQHLGMALGGLLAEFMLLWKIQGATPPQPTAVGNPSGFYHHEELEGTRAPPMASGLCRGAAGSSLIGRAHWACWGLGGDSATREAFMAQ